MWIAYERFDPVLKSAALLIKQMYLSIPFLIIIIIQQFNMNNIIYCNKILICGAYRYIKISYHLIFIRFI